MNLINTDITGVILAGGQCRRMGFNKADALIHGESMLMRMVDKLKELTPEVLVSCGTDTYPNISLIQVPDEYSDCGPLGGIYSALRISNTSLNLVVSCDLPLVSNNLLKYIVACAGKSDAFITVPVDHEGQFQMTCALYRKEILPILEQQLQAHAFKIKDLLALVSVEYVKISNKHPLYQEHNFMNVNSPSNLEEARKLWKK